MSRTTATFTEAELRDMVDVRRDLHAHPEIAFQETRTSGIVADRLKQLGLEVRTGVGKTGVLATIRGGRPGPTVLLRADMDALPIHEENAVPYRSTQDGTMHACGHDCHTSVLLALARHLVRERESLAGAVKLCFQPAEEQGGGALAMIADGALENPKVDAAFGIHVWQDLDLGKVAATPGPFMASVDEFEIALRGRGGHAAMPHLAIDPVLAGAHVITALQTLVSRSANPFKELVVSVTEVRAGTAFNIIPETAILRGTLRTFDDEIWNELPARLEQVVRGVASALGCTADVRVDRHNRATVNDPEMAALVRSVAAGVVGSDHVLDDLRTMGGEDFSWFLDKVPGCFIAIGSRNESRGLTFGHHHPRFDVDEACLEIGAEVLLRSARAFLAR